MKRSLQTRLFWGHVLFFLIASTISIFITWEELAYRTNPAANHNLLHALTSQTALHVLLWAIMVSCAPVLFIALASWWLTRRILSPIVALTQRAEHIQEDNLHQLIPVRGSGDEIDRLTFVLNEMMGRLDASFQRIREFTLHASHELKTPLTILRNGFETGLGDSNLTERQRDQLCVWLDETDRLNRIVSGLTFLTQADAQQVDLHLEPLDIGELVRDTANDASILGAAYDLKISVDIKGHFLINGDRHRLRQILLNLTDNAVKYNREGGYVNYRLRQDGDWYLVDVESGGRGISKDEMPKIFDRFFRSGNSRGSSSEGCGLGLSIARWIAEKHGGTLTARSSPDCTVLTLTLKKAESEPVEGSGALAAA